MRPILLRLAAWLAPRDFFVADRVSTSGRLLLRRMALGVGGVVVGGAGVVLLAGQNWREVLAGALIAWGVAVVIWAGTSYREDQESAQAELRRIAEQDLLHARLNQIAAAVGAPLLSLNVDIEPVIAARMERLAHLSGNDELHLDTPAPHGLPFWSSDALGRAPGDLD